MSSSKRARSPPPSQYLPSSQARPSVSAADVYNNNNYYYNNNNNSNINDSNTASHPHPPLPSMDPPRNPQHNLAPMRPPPPHAPSSVPHALPPPHAAHPPAPRHLADLAMPSGGMNPAVSGAMYGMAPMGPSGLSLGGVPGSYGAGVPRPLPAVSGVGASGALVPGRGNGLDYAVMRKEKAREEYKEKRRLELLASGEVDRTKRRKKNDTSMSENQKYHRRLKMNQDSAAAARHAQEVYVETLEKLVETTEAEKSILSIQALNLRTERDELVRRVEILQHQLNAAAAEGAQQAREAEPGNGQSDKGRPNPGAVQAQIDLKAVLELMDASHHGAPTEYRNAAVYPPPAM